MGEQTKEERILPPGREFKKGDKVRYKGDPTLDPDNQFGPDDELQIGAEGVVMGKARTADVWVDFGFDRIPMHASELELVEVSRRRKEAQGHE